LEARQLYRACYVLTEDVGEERQEDIVGKYHYGQQEREKLESAIAQAAGVAPHQVIVYCPSVAMSLPEAEVPVRLPDGRIIPLSGSNNEEIRILKSKHKALWRFFVFLDRSASAGYEAARAAAAELLMIP
jgi:hypothetical protein